jgi:hypothetical protein
MQGNHSVLHGEAQVKLIKLRIIYNAFTGDHVPDGLVKAYVNNRLAEFAKGTGYLEQIEVGNGTIIDEFRLRILKGEVHHESICFVYAGRELQPNEYAVMEWPSGFADFSNDQIGQILTLQSKKKGNASSK